MGSAFTVKPLWLAQPKWHMFFNMKMQYKTPSLYILQDGNGGKNILNKISIYKVNYN
jgi:hypothetical protein